jgi:hypothetical protein
MYGNYKFKTATPQRESTAMMICLDFVSKRPPSTSRPASLTVPGRRCSSYNRTPQSIFQMKLTLKGKYTKINVKIPSERSTRHSPRQEYSAKNENNDAGKNKSLSSEREPTLRGINMGHKERQ